MLHRGPGGPSGSTPQPAEWARAPSQGDSSEPEQEAVGELTGCRLCFPGSKLLRKLTLEKFGLEAHL